MSSKKSAPARIIHPNESTAQKLAHIYDFKVFLIKPGRKDPMHNGWQEEATNVPAEIEKLFARNPDANIGISCAGFITLDLDTKNGKDGMAALKTLPALPSTLETITPSGGRHLFFKLPEEHPGVPNSTSTLANGIDVRSRGGLVVAPGSKLKDGGAYKFNSEAARTIADAPEWLIEKLGTAGQKKYTTPSDKIPDAPDLNVENARLWLAPQPPAIQGQAGDMRTYAIGCKLRDLGVSEQQALELMMEWNDRCDPPWGHNDLATKVKNAFAYAQNSPGAAVALASDFPVVNPPQDIPADIRETAQAAIDKARDEGIRMRALLQQKRGGLKPLIKGIANLASYAEIYGAPGVGKTFVALDIAYAVAAGRQWENRKTAQGVVAYLCFEGTGGIIRRLEALEVQYGAEHGDVPLYLFDVAWDMCSKVQREAIGEKFRALPAKPILIVIDTFARALRGDENSAKDVGEFNKMIAALIQYSGACVLIIHHTGKDKSKGARGSSALLAAIDTELEIENHTINSTKQRDMPLAPPIGFKLVPIVVGIDEDGDSTESCIILPAEIQETKSKPKGSADNGFSVLTTLAPDNKPVHLDVWRQKCIDEFLEPKGARQGFYRIKKTLLGYGLIEIDGEMVTRRMH